MMRALVHACLQARWLVALAAVALLVAGAFAAGKAPVDAFPEFAPPLVEVQTEAPGLSSLEVENLVTTPLESSLAGTSFSTTVRSRSVLGLSSVVVLFQPGTDIFVARQLVQERVTRVQGQLPTSARTPTLLPPLSSTSRMLKIGLTSEKLSQADLTDLVQWTVRPQLLAIPGVSNVAVWGAREREYTVQLDPARLDASAVSADEAVRAIQGATATLPGGYLDGPLQRFPVQHVATALSVAALEELPVATRGGGVVRVRDVADVADSFPPPIGDAVVNDRPGLLLILEKQPWGNTLEITQRVDDVLEKLKPSMPGVEVDATIFRPAEFIQRSISNLETAMAIGCCLVIVILFLFLWSWRTALISAIAIPLSLGVAMLVLRAFDVTINTMILAGLVIALGEVVDDAIIDVENVLRRLRENRLSPNPRAALAVALDASLEVRSAVVQATAIVVLVFLPVWFLGGVSGAFFRPLALAYVLGVLASMVVALTVTPALSLILLPAGLDQGRHSPIMRRLERLYASLLPHALRHPRLLLGTASGVLAVAGLGFSLLGNAFLPDFKESDFLMHWVAQPGTSLQALQRTTLRVSKDLRAVPGVSSFGAHLGRAESADEVVGQNFGELWVHVDPNEDHDQAAKRIGDAIAPYPGIRRDVETYLRERIDEVITGTSGNIVVRIYGHDLEALQSAAKNVAELIGVIPDVKSARVEQQALVPEVRVEPKREAAALGFLPGDVRRAVALLVRGERVGETVRDGRIVPIVVRGLDSAREDVATLRDTVVVSATGARARLGDVASLTLAPTPNTVPHEGGSRRIDVSVHVHGDLGEVAARVQQVVQSVTFPQGHYADVIGEWRERENAQRRLALLAVASFALIVIVLYRDLETWRRTALVVASLPFALVGGVAGAWFTGGVLSLGSLVGLVTVLGIAARNGILLVSHYRHLEGSGRPFGFSLVVQGTIERLGPIVMTALATALALVPLVVAGDRPGHEIEHPMAVVILGGLGSSTLMNLVVMPALYLRFGGTSSRTEAPAPPVLG